MWNANRDYSLVWSENRMLRGTAETALWRRMSWAPDGAALCVPNATPPNNSFPVARTVLRDPQWNADLSLVGHELPTVVGRFHPRLFTPANEAPEQAREEDACPSSLLCLGAYDGSLSFWVSGRERAVVALHSALPGTVTDVAWLHGQAVLIAVSESGDAVAVRADDTVGPPSSSELVARRLGQLYGAYAGTMATSSIAVAQVRPLPTARRPLPHVAPSPPPYQVMQGERSEEGSGVREGGAIAPAARQTEAEDPSAPCPSSASATAPAPSAQQLDVRSLQQESRAKGRRRILPCLVASTSSADVERPAADDEFGHEEEEEEEVEAGAMAMAAQHGGPRLPLRPRMPTNGRDTGLHSPQRAAGRGEGAATPDRALRNAASPGGRSMRTGISATAVTPLRDARQLSGGAGSHRADAAARSMRACFKAARGTHRIATAVASSLVPSSKSSLAKYVMVAGAVRPYLVAPLTRGLRTQLLLRAASHPLFSVCAAGAGGGRPAPAPAAAEGGCGPHRARPRQGRHRQPDHGGAGRRGAIRTGGALQLRGPRRPDLADEAGHGCVHGSGGRASFSLPR